jgi:hypothetical protein
VTIRGGHFNRIDDHYGRNYLINGVNIDARTVVIDGYGSPSADIETFHSVSTMAVLFAGCNIRISNCTISGMGVEDSILSCRTDTPDLYGNISIRDISLNGGDSPNLIEREDISTEFDFTRALKVPDNITIKNVWSDKGIKVRMSADTMRSGSKTISSMNIINCGLITGINLKRIALRLVNCSLSGTDFSVDADSSVDFISSTFTGNVTNLANANVRHISDLQQ